MNLFPAQSEDAERLSQSTAKILGNGIATGKTRVILAGFENLFSKNIADTLLVVAPASVAYLTWPEEIERVMPKPFQLHMMKKDKQKRMAEYDKVATLGGRHIILLSYEIMTRDAEILRLLQKVTKTVIVADEAHALKNYKSQRSKAWAKLIPNSVCAWLVTGSLGEKPEHYYGADQALGKNTFGNRTNFLNKYCLCNVVEIETANKCFELKVPVGFKASAFKTLEEWTKKYVIRRPIDESKLPILLPPQERVIDLSDNKRTEYNKLKRNPDGDSRISNFFQLRGFVAEAKLDDLIENLLPQLLEDRTTLIFTPFKTQAVKIKERIEKELGIKCAEFTGDVGLNLRKHYVEELGTTYKVMVMTEAGKEGVDGLQKASVVVFYDYPWSASDRRQIIGRARRIGQERDDVLIITQHVPKSPDDKMKKLLEDKDFSLDFLLNMAEKQWEEFYKEL